MLITTFFKCRMIITYNINSELLKKSTFKYITHNHEFQQPYAKRLFKNIVDLSKLKAFTDEKIECYSKVEMHIGRSENIVGKGENAGYQHFLLFPPHFQKASF